ncbi:RBPJ-interacting and tubulin-associated protein 1 [Hemicordylus capensis]|uniref:RBPJ-interacting and tubulin-associated protein 1 n=1 Tax=Hemicordylus capensis TaxID=884348 RepID=UPI002302F64D|nr:RBPJ-interacting and tubulin-associated protein 1 [Hemicordylus capensis]
MKPSAAELAASGLQAPQLQRGGRAGYRLRAKPSYVDEALFGGSRQAGRRQAAARVAFAPPWADEKARPLLPSSEAAQRDGGCLASPAPSAGTPRKPHKYRLKSHTPSYCDETLFGPKPGGQEWPAPWMEEAVAKLRPLLWTPPSAPRDRPDLSSHPKETLVRAPRREMPSSPGTESFGTQHREERSSWRRPEGDSDLDKQAVLLGQPPSQSLTRIYSGSDWPQTAPHKLGASRQPGCSLPAASAKPLSKPWSKGVPVSPSASRLSKATSLCKPRPPWK